VVHRLFAPIVLVGIALGGCAPERELRAATAAEKSQGGATTARRSKPQDAGADALIGRDARPPKSGPPTRRRKRPRATEPLMIL
jgi:hypothetical protein